MKLDKEINILFIASLLFCLFVFDPNVSAQNCSVGSATTELNVNNVNARLNTTGGLWWNGQDAKYQVPNDPTGPSAIYSGGFWVGGVDPGGNLKIASQTYNYSSGDYYPGTLDPVTGQTSIENCQNFDRFFEASGIEILFHKNDWEDNGEIDFPIPNSILGWPAKSNPYFSDVHGFELSSGDLAPFIDENNDGVYDPYFGDRPYINQADEGVWWVFNDNGGPHQASGGTPLQMEFQVLAYAYLGGSDPINDATFYDLKMINKATEDIDSFIFGLFLDFDLGCHTDDYIGCIPDLDMGYVYNADEQDGSIGCECDFGVETYCNDAPLVGVKFLSGIKTSEEDNQEGMHKFMAYNTTRQPNTSEEYYRILNGEFPDKEPLTRGGDGYNPNSVDYVDFAFADVPSDENGWSMCTENIDQDTRVVMSTNPTKLSPHSAATLSFAVIYADNVILPCPSLDPLIDAANDVQDLFDTTSLSTAVNPLENSLRFEIWPNPVYNVAIVDLGEWSKDVLQMEVYSIDGKLVKSILHRGASTISMETADLNGYYMYKINLRNGRVAHGSFVAK